MDRDYLEKYLNAMIRFKNVGMRFPSQCGIQWSELLIMEKICNEYMHDSVCINVSEIQENMYISKPAVSQTLNSLEKKGYIVREIDTQDRRKISVQPTNEGKEVLNRSAMTYDEKIQYLSEQLGQEDMETLLRLLNKLADIVDDMENK